MFEPVEEFVLHGEDGFELLFVFGSELEGLDEAQCRQYK